MRKHLFMMIMLMLAVTAASAQKTVTVSGEATYTTTSKEPLRSATFQAIEKARTDAMEQAFGTRITQITDINISGGNVDVDSKHRSIVEGVWIKDLDEPEIDIQQDPRSDILTVTARVKGKAKVVEYGFGQVDVIPMRNGTDPKVNDASIFRENDRFYLYFNAPVDGYVTAYLLDNNDDVVCLLPYRQSSGEAYEVKKDCDYVFFSKAMASDSERGIVDEFDITCDDNMEGNILYVLFSPKKFAKPRIKGGRDNELQVLSLSDFNNWRASLKSTNDVYEKDFILTIKKRF